MRRPVKLLIRLAGLAAPLAVILFQLAGCSSKRLPFTPSPPLSSLIVSPGSDTVQVGQSAQFTFTALDTSGVVVGVSVSWSTSDPGIFTVSTSGQVLGVGEGVGLLIARASGLADTAFVSVFPDTGWFVQASNANGADLFGVNFRPDGRRGWAVGEAGTIVRTVNAGATWVRQTSNTGFALNAVWFTSDVDGWAVGAGGTVLMTDDAGTTWTRLSNTVVNTAENLKDVCFATPDTGWVVGTNGVILRTFDHGDSWQKLNPTASTLESVSFAGTRDGWAVGSSPSSVILGTHDRGLSWFVVQPNVTVQALRAVSRRSESVAFAVGQQGAAPRTVLTPDSTAWELRVAGAQFQLEGVYYPTDMIGYAVGANSGQGAALRTDDGGVTWETQTPRSSFQLNDVFFVDALRGWAVGDAGTIVHTARGGKR
jgi:photosystem II stability/assembly factor-like uncharacterized protein